MKLNVAAAVVCRRRFQTVGGLSVPGVLGTVGSGDGRVVFAGMLVLPVGIVAAQGRLL